MFPVFIYLLQHCSNPSWQGVCIWSFNRLKVDCVLLCCRSFPHLSMTSHKVRKPALWPCMSVILVVKIPACCSELHPAPVWGDIWCLHDVIHMFMYVHYSMHVCGAAVQVQNLFTSPGTYGQQCLPGLCHCKRHISCMQTKAPYIINAFNYHAQSQHPYNSRRPPVPCACILIQSQNIKQTELAETGSLDATEPCSHIRAATSFAIERRMTSSQPSVDRLV